MRRNWIIWYVTVFHLVWGLAILFNDVALPSITLALGIPDSAWAAILLVASLLAIQSIRMKPAMASLILVLPQQGILLTTALALLNESLKDFQVDSLIALGLVIPLHLFHLAAVVDDHKGMRWNLVAKE